MAEPTERYTACVSDEPLENIRRNEAEADFNLATSRFRRLFNELDKVTRERDEARAKHENALNAYDAAIRDCHRMSASLAELRADKGKLIEAAKDLVEALCEVESFEVEAGMCGSGPLIAMIDALDLDMPKSLHDWLDNGAETP